MIPSELNERQRRGLVAEGAVAGHLMALGWHVVPYGVGRWDYDGTISQVLRRLRSPLMGAPDFLAVHDAPDRAWLVDVKWPTGSGIYVETEALRRACFAGVRVVFVWYQRGCADAATCVRHCYDGAPTPNGSGTPYQVIDPTVLQPVEVMFA